MAAARSYAIQVERQVAVPAHRAYEVVQHVEAFPTFMPNVRSVTVLERTRTRTIAHWTVDIDEVPLDWVEEGIYAPDDLLVTFRAVEGVFDRFDGTWRVRPLDGASTVELNLEYELGLPEIEDIIGPILQERLRENAASMLGYIDRRLESA